MKYSIHIAATLLLAMTAWTRGDEQIQAGSSKIPVKYMLLYCSENSTNTAYLLSAPIIALQSTQTVTIISDKPQGQPASIGLIEDALDKQAGIKIRHVSLKEALALDTIDMGRKETVLAVSFPPLPKQSSAEASNEVRSIVFPATTLVEIKKYYEGLSGTKVVYQGNVMLPLSIMYFTLNAYGPMTKDTALKILDIALAMQAGIKVSHDQPGQTLWLRNYDPPRKVK